MLTRVLLAAVGGTGSFPSPVIPTVPTALTITSPSEGGWVWFGAQRALRNGTETIAGYITGSSGGDVKAIRIDDAGSVVETTTMYDNFLLDDHEPPSFVVRPDGIIMAAFAYHVGDIYTSIATTPGSLPAGGNTVNITSQVGSLSGGAGYSYASIQYLPGEDRYYIFFRYHDTSDIGHLGYTYSDDDGATWAARTLVSVDTYHQIARTGDRLDFVMSEHPLYGPTSIYHMYYEGGDWFKTDGTQITASQPFALADTTLVYDGTTDRGWLWDVAPGPVVVYVVYEDPHPSGPWHYEYGWWSGSAWVTHEVADAGSAIYDPQVDNDYAGGIVLDHSDPRRILYSSNAGGDFQVYYGFTRDHGLSFTVTPLTSDSDKNVRPMWVVDHGDAIQALWLYGTYTDYFTYSQGIKGAGL